MVTAGADEGIDRACRAFLEPGRTILLPDPSFDMFDCSATLAGGELVRIPWRDEAFPIEAFIRDRKSTRLNSSHEWISYAVFCLKKKKNITYRIFNDISN